MIPRRDRRRLGPGRWLGTLTAALLCAHVACAPPQRLVKGMASPDAAVRAESAVRLRAYSSAGTQCRRDTKRLLIAALSDPDAEVRRLAAVGLIDYSGDDAAYRAIAQATARADGREREALCDALSRFPQHNRRHPQEGGNTTLPPRNAAPSKKGTQP